MQRILLVEDDKSIVMGLSYSLQQEGFAVEACSDTAGALNSIKKGGFALALLDISLPDGNGYDVCRAIKTHGDTPVIFLTACDDESNVVMGLDMGADDYIVKPFRLRELLSRIRSVLRRVGQGTEKTELHYRELAIHTKQAKVRKNGVEIPLTALEYRLLLTLASNMGRVLSRSQLLEGIWDIAGAFVNDNTLTVYIKRLREKIEDDPQKPQYIQTVRGLGYRMGD
ncbi:Two component system, signal transduction response regulator [Acididesulfobacillus acetoxydans]|uniref:Stage 0 sporulation protein A homolog n=1 Tax=Acididesulfobacillus acetoxydans TaxID=1561005 RepID=A0A8S0X417_9FIRM|nr:response regulator transcription factor [Acididesulfobacillus acetoxydans]CAA7600500.1 Two component system, signal transduction response regulator [Acididesulfobacillus acetoxydans]CEJ06634.1 Sensory transduction protein regX3 [Acididesulfobacillus acetoxydans]